MKFYVFPRTMCGHARRPRSHLHLLGSSPGLAAFTYLPGQRTPEIVYRLSECLVRKKQAKRLLSILTPCEHVKISVLVALRRIRTCRPRYREPIITSESNRPPVHGESMLNVGRKSRLDREDQTPLYTRSFPFSCCVLRTACCRGLDPLGRGSKAALPGARARALERLRSTSAFETKGLSPVLFIA